MSRIRASDQMKKIRTKPASTTLSASLLAMLSLGGPTTPCNKATPTRIGSSTIWGQIGFTRFTSCLSRVDSRTISAGPPIPFTMARSARCSRSFPARGLRVSKTTPGCSVTTPTFHAIPTSLTGTSISSANFAFATFPAASPMKYIWTSTSDGLRLNRTLQAFRSGCSMPMPPKSHASIRITTASSPRWKGYRYPVGRVCGQYAPISTPNGV
jgi:hypothetical protein